MKIIIKIADKSYEYEATPELENAIKKFEARKTTTDDQEKLGLTLLFDIDGVTACDIRKIKL